MHSTLTSLTNPRWSNAEQTAIDCDITTSQFGDEVLPFTASPIDCEPHGRAIFADIVAGAYGEIAKHFSKTDDANSSIFPTSPSGEIATVIFEG